MPATVYAEARPTYQFGVVGSALGVFDIDGNDTTRLRAEPMFTGVPGDFTHSDDPSITRDSLFLSVSGAMYSPGPWASKILPGRINSVAPSVTGSSFIYASVTSTWRAIPQWDTTAYTFRWLVNGQEQSGATGAQLARAFSAGGTYQVANVTIRADWTADTVVKTVNVAPPAPQVQTARVSSNGYPYLAWGSSSGAGSYRIHRQLHTQSSWALWRTLTTLSFEDAPTKVQSHNGSIAPPSGTPWVANRIVAVTNGYEGQSE